ncbi:HD-GYP domain-containing protein [Mesobacillus maritimus]|uniref:HD-GYP domain-containing protein n=1 Tax=Mesobacillus maritimus TaxID=1643336 RepID=UPI002040315A|nr:HD-GYP domain-containing protein [Mesobacillus maritimus]
MLHRLRTRFHDPRIFRYGFWVLLAINSLFLFLPLEVYSYLLVFILNSIFLGIGYSDRSNRFLSFFTIVIVFLRFVQEPVPTILKLITIVISYLLIVSISVGYMRRSQRLKEEQFSLVFALSKALDSRDTYTSGHSHNVAYYATEIARKLNLPKEMVEVIKMGGLLHDIGKIGIPESILLKPGKLTDSEYDVIKRHPVIGYEMIKHVKHFQREGILDIVLSHHERFDGEGYPNRLKGTDIPLVARIMAVADSFDAITSKRTYSPEVDLEAALLEMKRNRGTQFDPEIVDVFLSLFESEEERVFRPGQSAQLQDGVQLGHCCEGVDTLVEEFQEGSSRKVC